MKKLYCIKCGKQLEDDTKFCIFCGSKQEDDVASFGSVPLDSTVSDGTQILNEGAPSFEPAPDVTAPSFDHSAPNFSQSYQEPVPEKKKSSAGKIVLIVVAAVLILALLALNAYQYFVLAPKADDALAESEKELKAVKADLADLEDEYAALEDELDGASEYADLIDDIAYYSAYYNLGVASSDYYCNNGGVLVMHEGDSNSIITITCSYPEAVTVNLDVEGNAADANFSGEFYGDCVDISVSAERVGVSLISFGNDINYETFSVMVIVLP